MKISKNRASYHGSGPMFEKPEKPSSIIFILILSFMFISHADVWAEEQGFNYSDYDKALKKHLNRRNMVFYSGLKKDRADLDSFVALLKSLPEKKYNGWSKKEKIAFWINAYNGLTLKAIIDHYPIESSFFGSIRFPKNSIRQISGVWDEIEFDVMGRKMTLNDIEHQTLRKKFNEPRIHLALVCAALGCPPLRREPFMGVGLNEQLDDQAEQFFGNQEKFRIDHKGKTIYLSKIFKWFGKDFIGKYGTSERFKEYNEEENAVLNFVSRYLNNEDIKKLEREEYDIEYLDYDWTLNEAK
ncbi:MAG: DUF547 domain-containing protein [Spirochaetes bacterium]|nr:DUF547 domain-containing protein [Spirochaetota bacterium]